MVRFIRLCMRVRVILGFVNCLEMIQNTEIKMTYLIFVVFLSVLGVSGAFRAVVKLTQKYLFWTFPIEYKSYKSHPKLGPPVIERKPKDEFVYFEDTSET